MDMTALVLLAVFFILLFLNVPISVCIGLATMSALLMHIDFTAATTTIAQQISGGIDSFALLAIPFFIVSGLIMGQGGIAKRLIESAMALIGFLPGGLALVNVMSCMLFGAISGSAVAATSAIGSFMVPEMKKHGYDENFAAAVTCTAATTGLLIPPSNILIIYAIASGGVSIAALFIAGYLPGILVGLALMMVCSIYAIHNKYPVTARLPFKIVVEKVFAALPSLMLVVVVIGGIIMGVFTATEAGAIAVLYALVLAVGIYKEIPLSSLPKLFLKACETTAIVMLIIGASSAMSWLLSYAHIPQAISDFFLTLSDNPIIILLLINLILILVGAFIDMTPAVLIFTPIFLPVAEQFGMSPIQFGIMLVLNLCIGLVSPPVGSVLFVSCAVAKTSIHKIIKPMLPLYFVMFLVLLMVTYIPAISEALPRLFGLI
ncbi:TRAP transporter large permease [Paraglaciecola aquimarina]|uniref:TRAP transporter large permease protein n=1 Tax=Paraglaciecola algarum TaxID=3050085 RepID=A0ABS9D9F2_9ALTE|nr:TRAP transporter large permease [Paraglaciecola sp. G1-23]MCF2949591.1 TRAP transporter large permease [Paraglaciecola sp. G1-23]